MIITIENKKGSDAVYEHNMESFKDSVITRAELNFRKRGYDGEQLDVAMKDIMEAMNNYSEDWEVVFEDKEIK